MRQKSIGNYTELTVTALSLSSLAFILIVLLWSASSIMLLLFLGVLLAVFLDAIADFFRVKLSLPRGWALTLAILFLLALTGLAWWLIGPSLIYQTSMLVDEAPQLLQEANDHLLQYPLYDRLVGTLREPGEVAPVEDVVPQAAEALASAAEIMSYIFLVGFGALFIAVNPSLYQDGLTRLVPRRWRERARQVLAALGRTLRGWLLGQFISMVIVGTLTSLGLWALGAPLALALGVLAGLFEFIPFIGPILAAIPAVLLAFTEGPTHALFVVLLYVVIQQVQGTVIMPLIQQQTVDLPPAFTIVAVLVMATLFGFVGALVAAPLIAVLLTLVKMLYVHDALGDEVELPGEP